MLELLTKNDVNDNVRMIIADCSPPDCFPFEPSCNPVEDNCIPDSDCEPDCGPQNVCYPDVGDNCFPDCDPCMPDYD